MTHEIVEVCCGKSVVFLGKSSRYVCSRCRTLWVKTEAVRRVKRTDWDVMREEINDLHKRLSKKPKSARMGYSLTFGGILNAFREGDISFKKAIAQLKKVK